MIIENGVHELSIYDYHSSKGISRSGLFEFKKTPLHFWHKYLNPNATKKKPTPAMILGNIIHTIVLEHEEFDNRYAVKPNLDRRTKEGKSYYEFFMSTLGGREAISTDDYELALSIKFALEGHPEVVDLLDGMQIEKSIYFTHKETGLQCKARPDAWLNGIVVDLKSAKDASMETFKRESFYNGYYLQAGIMHEALDSIGIKLNSFAFLPVEKEDPHAHGIYLLDDAALQYGINLFNELMLNIKKCFDADKWPGYGIQNLELYHPAKYENLLEMEE